MYKNQKKIGKIQFQLITYLLLVSNICGPLANVHAMSVVKSSNSIELAQQEWGKLADYTNLTSDYLTETREKLETAKDNPEFIATTENNDQNKEKIKQTIEKITKDISTQDLAEKSKQIWETIHKTKEDDLDILKKAGVVETYVDPINKLEAITDPNLIDRGDYWSTKATYQQLNLPKQSKNEQIEISVKQDQNQDNNYKIAFEPVSANQIQAISQNNQVIYSNQWDGADVVYTTKPDGVKEDIILKNENNRQINKLDSGYHGEKQWLFYYRLDLNNVTPSINSKGEVIFSNQAGAQVGQATAPIMTDNQGEISNQAYYDLITEEEYQAGYAIKSDKFNWVKDETDQTTTAISNENDQTKSMENDLTATTQAQNSWWQKLGDVVGGVLGIFGWAKAENDQSLSAQNDLSVPTSEMNAQFLPENTNENTNKTEEKEYKYLVLAVNVSNLSYPIDVDPTIYILNTSNVYTEANGKLLSNKVNDLQVYDTTKETSSSYSHNKELKSTLAINNKIGDVQPSNLVGKWTMDDNTGATAEDDSTTAAIANLINNPTWSSGEVNSALNFNGTDQYLQVNDNSNHSFNSDNFTIEAWINPTNTASKQGILGKGSAGQWEYYLGLDDIGKINFQAWQLNGLVHFNLVSGNNVVRVNEWSKITVVNDGGEAKLLVNNKIVASTQDIVGSMGDGTADLYIGRAHDQITQNYFTGKIDEVAIYQTALTDNELTNSYLNQRSKLIGWWRMNGDSSDSSGNDIDGVINGVIANNEAKQGQSYTFGTGARIDAGNKNSLSPLDDFTIEAWVKTYSGGEVVTKNNEYSLQVCPNGKPMMFVYINGDWQNNAGTGHECADAETTAINDGAWHHLSGSYDGNFIRLMIDGAQSYQYYKQGSVNATANNMQIGNDNFAGEIDEVALYNRILSKDEVKTHSNNGYESKIITVDQFDQAINNSEYSQLAFTDLQVERKGVLEIKGLDKDSKEISEKIKIRSGHIPMLVSGKRYKTVTQLAALDEYGVNSEQALMISSGKLLSFSIYHDANWRQGINKVDDGVTAIWNFDEGSGKIARDASGGNNSGYLAGGQTSTWAHEKDIYLSPATTVNNYQIRVKLDTQIFDYSAAKSDGSDLRFFDSNGAELDYWIENWDPNGDSYIWVEVAEAGTSQVKMKFGNQSAESRSDGEKVFDFFDDFNTADNNKFSYDQGFGGYSSVLYNIENGILKINSSNSWRILRMKKNFGPSDTGVIGAKMKTAGASQWYNTFLVQFDSVNYNRFGMYMPNNLNWQMQYVTNNSTTTPQTMFTSTANTWYKAETFKKSNNNFQLKTYNNDWVQTNSYETTQTAWNNVTWTWVTWLYENVFNYYDWIYVRKYASVEPTITVGANKLPSEALASQSNWMDSNWGNRTKIFVHNELNNFELSNYQAFVAFDSQDLIEVGKLLSSADDLRFTDSDGVTSLPYWIESGINSHQTKVWVKLPTLSTKSTKEIFVYYGNSSAVSNSNYDNVFTKNFNDNGLYGLWHMDENSGTTIADAGSYNTTGTLYNGVAWQTTNKAPWDSRNDVSFGTDPNLSFDGSDDYVYFNKPNVLHKNTDAALEFWIYPTNTTSSKSIFWTRSDSNDTNRFNIYTNSNNLYLDYRDPGGTTHSITSTPITINQWAHIAIVRQSNTYFIYKNGVLSAQGIDSNPYLPTTTDWTIAGRSGYRYSGIIDEVRSYERSLSGQEVKSHFERRLYTPNKVYTTVAQSEDSSVPVWSTDGKYGKALSFDGKNDSLVVPNDDSFNTKNELTVGGWIKAGAMNGWIYNTPLTLTPPAPLDNYQIKVTLTASNFDYTQAKSDGSDLRFTDSQGNKIGYWVEKWMQGETSVIWIKVPTAGTKKINMYYGNNNANSESNFDNVFTKDFGTDNTLKGWWKLDENTGTIATDASGNGLQGNLQNNPTWMSGDGGRWGDDERYNFTTGAKLSFDGTNDYINVGDQNALDTGANISIEGWIYPTNLAPAYQMLIGKSNYWSSNDYGLHYRGGYGLEFFVDNCRDNSYYPLQTNKWYYVTATYDGSYRHLFVDGKEVRTSACASKNLNNNFNFTIGAATAGNYNFNGQIDEVRVYNRVITNTEISRHYNRRLFANSESMVTVGNEITPATENLYQRNISLDIPAQVDNYIATVNLNSSNFDLGKIRNDASDIKFFDNSGNTLNHWIEEESDQTKVIKVKLPLNTDSFKMAYGNKQMTGINPCDGVSLKCDNFNDGQLDLTKWGKYRVDENSWNEGVSQDGWLALQTQNAKGMDGSLKNAPIMWLGDLANENYEVQAKVKFDPTENGQTAGLIIYQDDNNWVQGAMEYDGAVKAVFKMENKGISGKESVNIINNSNYWQVKITKVGTEYRMYYKLPENTDWTFLTNLNAVLDVQKIGLATYSGTGANNWAYFDDIIVLPKQPTSIITMGGEQSWNYKRNINLSATTSADNQQYKVILTTSNFDYNHAKSDGSDLRFFDQNNNLLSYWIENWNATSTSNVWVKIPEAGINQIQMYYGNSGADNLSNGDKVFEFFDDFTGSTLDVNKWIAGSGFGVSGGVLNATNTNQRLQSVQNFTGNYVMESRHYTNTEPSNGYMPLGWYENANNDYGVLFHPTNNWHTRNDNNWRQIGGLNYVFYWTKIIVAANGANSYAQIVRETDNATSTAYDSNSGLSNEKITLGYRYDNAYNNQTYNANWDWIAVRKYNPNTNDPTGTPEAEQRWMFGKNITLTPATPSDDYQVKIELNAAGFDYKNTQDDGADIRFYAADGTKLNHWIERWDRYGQSTVWVKIPEAGTGAIRMYYGNPEALNESNGPATFDFFDNFSNYYLESSKWNWTRSVSGQWDEGISKDGWLTMTAMNNSNLWETDNSAPVLTTNQNFASGDYEVSVKAMINPTTNYQQGGLIIYESDQTHVQAMRGYSDGQKVTFKSEASDNAIANDQALSSPYVDLSINKIGQHYKMLYKNHGNASWLTHSTEFDATLTSQKLGLTAYSDIGTDTQVNFTDFRVRKTSTTEPVASFDAEESKETINTDNLLKKGNAYALGASDAIFYGTVGTQTLETPINTGWTHVAMTYDGKTQRLFVNGQQKIARDYDNNLPINTNDLILGNTYFGLLDDVVIAKKTMSETQISDWYNQGHAYARTNPTENSAENISITGRENSIGRKLMVKIVSSGTTGVATYKTSKNDGLSWSEATYTTSGEESFFNIDDDETGLGIIFAVGANWSAGDSYKVASWYTEPRSVTRGINRAFPSVANIVATDKSVEILDATDDSLWIRFTNTQAYNYLGANSNITSIDMTNGRLWLGSNNATDSIGVLQTDFIQDQGRYIRNIALPEKLSGNIRQRNISNNVLPDDTITLNDIQINDLQVKNLAGKNYLAAATESDLELFDLEQDEVVRGTRYNDKVKQIALTDNGQIFAKVDSNIKAVLRLNNILDYTNDFSLNNRSETYRGITATDWPATYEIISDADSGNIYDIAIKYNSSLADNDTTEQVAIGSEYGLSLINGLTSEGDNTATANRKDGLARYITIRNTTENMNGVGVTRGMWLAGDQTGTAIADWSGRNHPAQVHGFLGDDELTSADWVSGVRGKALNFDGTNDYLSITDNSDYNLGESATWSAWVRPESSSSKYILGQTNGTIPQTGITLMTENNGANFKYKAQIGSGTELIEVTSKDFAPNSWHMVTAVADGQNKILKLLVDGFVEDDATMTSEINDSSSPLTIGWAQDGDKYFDGQITGVLLTANALTEKQIKAMQQIGAGALADNNDTNNEIAGNSSEVQALAFSNNENKIYIGTSDGLTELNYLTDSWSNYWTEMSTPALPSRNVKKLAAGENYLLTATDSGVIALKTDGSNTNTDTVGKLQSGRGNDVFTDGTYNYYVSDKGLDVVTVSTQNRKGYIAHEKGFNSVTALNNYVYTGTADQGIWRAKVSTLNNETNLNIPYLSTGTYPAIETNHIYDLQGRVINRQNYLVAGTDRGAILYGDIDGIQPKLTIFRNNDNDQVTKVWLNEDGDLAYFNATTKSVCVFDNAINSYLGNYQTGSNACTRSYGTETKPEIINTDVNDLVYTANTSTALSGANTLYIATKEGVSVIQENPRATGTVKHIVNGLINDERTGLLLNLKNYNLSPHGVDDESKDSVDKNDGLRNNIGNNKQDLAGWWDFDQTITAGITDRSGNNNQGSFGAGAGLAGGKLGKALYLNGKQSFLNIGDDSSLHPTNSFTISGWFWKDDALSNKGNNEPILASKYDSGNNGEFVWYWKKNNKLQLKVGDGANSAWSGESSAIGTNNWHYLSVVFNKGEVKFFVDGELNYTGNTTVTNLTSPPYQNNPNSMAEMYLGNNWQQDSGWAGYMDEVAYWRRALNDEQAKDMAQSAQTQINGIQTTSANPVSFPTSAQVATNSGTQETMHLTFDETLSGTHGVTPTKSVETSWQKPNLNLITYNSSTNNNIVLDKGATGSWDEVMVHSPNIVKDGDIYQMWYTGRDSAGKNRIGLATSNDGISWVRYPINNCTSTTGNGCVLDNTAGKFDSNEAYSPSVIKENDLYKMWYAGYNGSVYAVGYATSPDGINWTKQNSGDPVLTAGASDNWDDNSVTYPSVIKDGAVYKMWYSGKRNAGNYRLGYATSNDGINWTRYNNPENATCGFAEGNDSGCLVDLGNIGKFDNNQIESPEVAKYHDKYYLFYSGRANDGFLRTGLLTAENGVDWTRANDGDSIISLGNASTWDVTQHNSVGILSDANQFLLYYGGNDNTNTCIGIASMQFGSGRYGKALYIGNNDQLIYPIENKLKTNQGTISAWIKMDNTSDDTHSIFNLFGDGGKDGLFVNAKSGQITAGYNNQTTITATNTLTNNYWHQLTLSWEKPGANNSNFKLYLDDNLVGSSSFESPLSGFYDQIMLGAHPTEDYEYLKGNLDDFRIYNLALNQAEITELYNGSLGNSSKVNLDIDANSATSNPMSDGTYEFNYIPDYDSATDNNLRTLLDVRGGDTNKFGPQYSDSQSASNRLRIWKEEGSNSDTKDVLHFGIIDNDGDLYEVYTAENIDWQTGKTYKIAASWKITSSSNIMRILVDNTMVAGNNFTTGLTGSKKKNGTDININEMIVLSSAPEKWIVGSGENINKINRMLNGSFETNNASDPANWTKTGAITYDSTGGQSHDGKKAVMITGPASSNKLTQTISGVTAGNYTVGWWSRGVNATDTQIFTVTFPGGSQIVTNDPGTDYVFNSVTVTTIGAGNIVLDLSADSDESVWYDGVTLTAGRMAESYNTTASTFNELKTSNYALSQAELSAEYLTQTYTTENKNASLAGETNNVTAIAVKKINTMPTAADDILLVGTKGLTSEGALTQITFAPAGDTRSNEWRQAQGGLNSNRINSLSYHPVRNNLAVATADAGVFGIYDEDLAIFVNVTTPTGVEEWKGGTNHEINWLSSGNCDHMDLSYSSDGGTNYHTINANVEDTGSYYWNQIPALNSAQMRVRVSCMDVSDNVLKSGVSNGNFVIDSTAPIVRLNPISNPRGDNVVIGRGYATDNGGAKQISAIEYKVDDEENWYPAIIRSGAGTTNVEYDFSTSALSSGEHRLWVRGKDSTLPGGNESDQTLSASQLVKIDELSVNFNQSSFNLNLNVGTGQTVSNNSIIVQVTGYNTNYAMSIKANRPPEHQAHPGLYIPFYTANNNWTDDSQIGFGWKYDSYNQGKYNTFPTDHGQIFKLGRANTSGEETKIDVKTVIDWSVAAGNYNNQVEVIVTPKY